MFGENYFLGLWLLLVLVALMRWFYYQHSVLLLVGCAISYFLLVQEQ